MTLANCLFFLTIFAFSLIKFSNVYASENPSLKTLLGAQLLQAMGGEITDSDYQKLSFNRCDAIKKHQGFSESPLGEAIHYSCKGLVIGIAFYAGDDLGKHAPEKVAQLFRKKLSEQNMTSDVFVKQNHRHGSVMAFFINGESYHYDWVGPLHALETLEGLSAEARLFFLKNKQITSKELEHWVKGNPPEKIFY